MTTTNQNSETKNWSISILDPAPAMTQTRKPFVGTYSEAKTFAESEYKNARRPVAVWSAKYDTYYWYRIDSRGTEDRNTIGGVVVKGQLN